MKKDNPLKAIFSRNDDINKIAFLNWRMDSGEIINLFNLGDAYFDSALILIDTCLADNKDKKADIIIFPIFTCVNHGIEVHIKGLTILLNKIIQNELTIDGTHYLNQLFDTLKARIKDLDGQKALNEFEKDFVELSEYIEELGDKLEASQKNDKMDFSRYPFSKKKENHFYVDNFTNVEVDLENLKERILIIKKKIENISDFYYYTRFEKEQ